MKPAFWIIVLSLILLPLMAFQGMQIVITAQKDSLSPSSVMGDVLNQTNSRDVSIAQQVSFTDEIRALIDKWQGSSLVGEGWLHIIETHDRNKDQVGVLSNGEGIPMDYVTDSWYHLGQDGKVVALVTLMKDMGEHIVQISTFNNGIWRNLTVGEEWTGGVDQLNLDFGFINDITNSDLYGSVVSREEKETNGSRTIVFSLSDVFEQPTVIAGYDTPVIEGVRRIAFEEQTGAILFVERLLRDENRKERLVERTEILLIEKLASPPGNILDYLVEP